VLRGRLARIASALALAVVLTLACFAAGSVDTAYADTVFRLNGDIYVDPDQVVDTASTLNGDIVIEGHVLDTAFAANGDIEVRSGGRVDGDAVSLTGHVLVEEGGVVGGEIVELGGTQITSGSSDSPAAESPGGQPVRAVDKGGAFGRFFFLLGSLGLGLLLIMIAGTSLRGVGQELEARPGRSALVSLGASLGLPILWVILLISVVGIPVALLMIPVVPLVSMFGLYAIALVVGERLLILVGRESAGPAWAMLAGVALLAVVSFVPILGALILMTGSFLGLGATLARIWDVYQTRRMIKSAAYLGGAQPTVTPRAPAPYAPEAPPDPQDPQAPQAAATHAPEAPQAPEPAAPSAPPVVAEAPETPGRPEGGPRFHI